MVYAYLQQGRDAEALAVISRTKTAADRFYGALLGYNGVAMQARHSLERSEWSEAATLPVPVGSAPFIEAVARFARAIGAARSGNVSQAEEDVVALGALRDSLNSRRDSYWATIAEAQRLAASAWVSHARGKSAEAARLAKQAADLEETVEKHPVTPGPLLPARELEGDLLMELGRADEALAAYDMTLTREPRRARALIGAVRAAAKAGKSQIAMKRYAELEELMKEADAPRKEKLRALAVR
jgi:tetratricopeptide (TPR) repeat protein